MSPKKSHQGLLLNSLSEAFGSFTPRRSSHYLNSVHSSPNIWCCTYFGIHSFYEFLVLLHVKSLLKQLDKNVKFRCYKNVTLQKTWRCSFAPTPCPMNSIGAKHLSPDMKKINLDAVFALQPWEMSNRTRNQHWQGEGGKLNKNVWIFLNVFARIIVSRRIYIGHWGC